MKRFIIALIALFFAYGVGAAEAQTQVIAPPAVPAQSAVTQTVTRDDLSPVGKRLFDAMADANAQGNMAIFFMVVDRYIMYVNGPTVRKIRAEQKKAADGTAKFNLAVANPGLDSTTVASAIRGADATKKTCAGRRRRSNQTPLHYAKNGIGAGTFFLFCSIDFV